MPKKMHTNSKAEAARERKENVKQAKKAEAEKAAEDAKWTDEGSTASEQRKAAKAVKDAEEARKRAEKKALQAKEEESLSSISAKGKLPNSEKITRAQLLRQAEQLEEERKLEQERQKLEKLKIVPQAEPELNLNRQASEEKAKDVAQYGSANVIHASGIDDTLSQVKGGRLNSSAASSSLPVEQPVKSQKSAFAEFEEEMMPIVRQENPRLKLSQYKEMVFKLWQKSPKNPFVQRKMAEQSLLESTDAWKYGNFRE